MTKRINCLKYSYTSIRKFAFKFIALIIFVCFQTSCHKSNEHKYNDHSDSELFTLLSAQETNIDFVNTVKNSPDFNIFSYRNFYNGGGVAIGDINNDGLPDIYVTSNMGENKLYINEGNLKFKDISISAGVTDKDKWSTGVSMVDINHDGWLDIYVCNAGYRKGSNSKNSLFINNGDLTFMESAEKFNLADDGYTTHAVFFDYDLDGDLDVYILNNSFIPVNTLNYSNKRGLRAKDWPVKDFLKGGGDKLMRNDGEKFTDVSENAGIYGSLIGFGLGVTVGDINGDLMPDIYVSNDFFERDYLYINKGDGTFSEELENRMQHISTSSMGADMADLNNDGCAEIFVTDMLPYDEHRLKTTTSFDNINVQNIKLNNGFYNQNLQNVLQINDCAGTFKETSFYSGVAASDWSWGALLFDADQDMLADIFVCNGIYQDVIDQDFIDFFANDIIQKLVLTGEKEKLDIVINKMPSTPLQNMAFRNKGRLKFEFASDSWGFHEKTFSNGAAYGDLDNDGDLDLIINNVNQPLSFYRNNVIEYKTSNFIGIRLKEESKNIDAIGATLMVYCGGQKLSRQHIPNRGFQSSMDLKINFGLALQTKVDSLVIFWPDKSKTTILNPKINAYLEVNKQNSRYSYFVARQSFQNIFEPIYNTFESHKENTDFIDFYFERNIPVMLSREGPKMAIGDINRDGKEDIYFCGAAGQAGQLYVATTNGFQKSTQPIFESFKNWEDTEALFFDADGDGDLDLFVGSGGNNGPPGSLEFQDRLYFNDGKGKFKIDIGAFPINGYNTSKAIEYDYDNDGDLDLFVASRSYPGEYGMDPVHFMYENNGKGKFTELLSQNKSPLANAGMITDAVWANVDGKDGAELVIVGEWMAPRIFKFENDQFLEIKTNLNNYSGWWQSVTSVDVDNDGDQDLILGNIGSNGYLQSEKYLPLKLFINDFDNNGMPEKILTRTVEGKDVPVVMKREMVEQLNILKKQNLKHHDYAEKTLQQLLNKSIAKAIVKQINYVNSYIAYSNGSSNFEIVELPMEVQLSSLNDVISVDINKDNYQDLIIVGNKNGFQPQFGQLDANVGLLLQNDGKGGFFSTNNINSGINIKGVSKQIRKMKHKNEDFFIVARNNDKPYTFTFKK
jgi:hypothetical protein